MPFKTSRLIAQQEARDFLKDRVIDKDKFLEEGLARANRYSEEHSQKGYVQGWEKTWVAERQFTEKTIEDAIKKHYGEYTPVSVIRRYRTKEGYMALTLSYNKYRILFTNCQAYLHEYNSTAVTESAAVEEIEEIAWMVGAESLDIDQS